MIQNFVKSVVEGDFFISPEGNKFKMAKIFVRSPLLRTISYVKILEGRDYSITYIVKSEGTEYVMKYIMLGADNVVMDEIESEIKIHQKCALAKLAPMIHMAFTFEKGGIIIMDMLDGQLGTYLTERINSSNVEIILFKLIAMVERLHELRIIHGDLSATNIMIKKVNDSYDFYFIDFGISKMLALDDDLRKRFLRDLVQLRESFDELHHDFQILELEIISDRMNFYLENRYPLTED